MIEPIFSSKLFAVSNRKEEIRAAANNPLNQNLMQQLATALDKSYQKAEYLLDSEEQEKLKQTKSTDTEPSVDESVKSEDAENTESETTSEPKGSSASPSKPSNLHGKFKEAEKNMTEDAQSSSTDDAPTDSSPTDTSTEAATDVIVGVEEDLVGDKGIQDTKTITESIKTTLNDNPETKGVSRASIKDDELWVYYEDSVNLNKVMANAIETLNSLDYELEFNRLARSDNAIVFLVEIEEI